MASLQLGPLTFSDLGTDGWVFRDLRDWYSVSESKKDIVSQPQGHGGFEPNTDWRLPAAISFTASYLADSEADALAAAEDVQALGDGSQYTMTVTDALRSTSRQVSIQSVLQSDHHGKSVIEFDFDVVAWDPRRYGDEVSASAGLPTSTGGLVWPEVFPTDWGTGGASGRVELTNVGRMESWPVLEVTGGLDSGFELTEILSGRVIRVERVIPEGSTVYIDNRSGQIWLDVPANSLTIFTTRYEWWSVPAGETRVVQFTAIGGSSGDPQLTGRIRPAY